MENISGEGNKGNKGPEVGISMISLWSRQMFGLIEAETEFGGNEKWFWMEDVGRSWDIKWVWLAKGSHWRFKKKGLDGNNFVEDHSTLVKRDWMKWKGRSRKSSWRWLQQASKEGTELLQPKLWWLGGSQKTESWNFREEWALALICSGCLLLPGIRCNRLPNFLAQWLLSV